MFPLVLNVIHASNIDLVSWASWCRPGTLSCPEAGSEQILLAVHLEIHNNFLLCGLSIIELRTTEMKIFKLIFRHGLNLFSRWP